MVDRRPILRWQTMRTLGNNSSEILLVSANRAAVTAVAAAEPAESAEPAAESAESAASRLDTEQPVV